MARLTPLRRAVPIGLAALCGTLALAVAGVTAPRVPVPDNNPQTPEKVELGRALFYDTKLSRNGDLSCASCHHQDRAFTDGRAVSPGSGGRLGTRNAPSLINVAYRSKLFWHGGSPSLELQALGPLTDHNELDLTVEDIAARLNASPEYVQRFRTVFGQAPDAKTTLQALAAFERTLVSFHSPYDRYQAGDMGALDASQVRGLDLFMGKAECFHCHTGGNFSDNQAHNNAMKLFNPDIGVAQLTDQEQDVGKFITPTLRNVALTAPYLHDGSVTTLEELVSKYNDGGEPNPNTDALIHPLGLSAQDEADLVAFLRALTDPTIADNPAFAAPKETP